MSTGNTNWDRMTIHQRRTAAAVDIMAHKEFALLSGVLMMGKISFIEAAKLPPGLPKEIEDAIKDATKITAGTDGADEFYGVEFMMLQNRKQWRWVVLHENFHKALHHCTEYVEIYDKVGLLANIAQDFVINAMIDEIDPQQAFAERPVGFDGMPLKICLDKKYYGKSFIEVLKDLIQKPKNGGKSGAGGGAFDIHIRGDGQGMTVKEKKVLKDAIEDALRQGKMMCDKLAGREKGGNPLDGLIQQRKTDWREPLRQFVQSICEGYDNSRFCPPNRLYVPHGIMMPTHFSESTGELHVYCDTSGSMGGVYPTVFGEIANICQTVRPEKVRVIWWDTDVCGEQEFKPEQYDDIANLMKPAGGGGTHPNCVVQYVTQKQYKPKCGIWLSDGYLDGSGSELPFPVLWGIVDNESFQPPQGQVIHIDSNNP